MSDLIIIGGGGHAKSVADIAIKNGYNVIGFLDDNEEVTEMLGIKRLGAVADCEKYAQKAKFVITTTFHGTVFSIINHKNFVSLPLSEKTRDVLRTLHLEDRELDFSSLSLENLENKLLNSHYDYFKVDSDIEKL